MNVKRITVAFLEVGWCLEGGTFLDFGWTLVGLGLGWTEVFRILVKSCKLDRRSVAEC